MKKLEIEIPEGYEIDQENSTFELILFKEIKKGIKSVEDAIAELGEEDEAVIQLRLLDSVKGISPKIIAEQELVVGIKALNEGWTPNWDNGEWDKWFVWYYLDKDPRFYASRTQLSSSSACSRLCLKSKELADYSQKIFDKQYKEYLTY